MTKKDYELIANTLRYTKNSDWDYIVLSLADDLESDNPKFNRDKFLTACGIEQFSCGLPFCDRKENHYHETTREL